MNLSQTQLANYAKMIASIVVMIMSLFGVVGEEDKISFIIFALFVLASSAYSFWDRFKKGDLTIGGIRK